MLQNFTDSYTYGPVIRRGGFGVVRKCFHLQTCTWRAVKTMDKERVVRQRKKSKVADIQNEIDILDSLQGNPRIVRMFDTFDEPSRIHIVMEFLQGNSLRDLVSTRHTETDLTEILKSMLQIVFYCHARDILYRDIKPDNFVFRRKHDIESLTGIDFGSSFNLANGRLTQFMGTKPYCGREVLIDGVFTKKSDIWAVGATMRELITGTRPRLRDGYFRHDDLATNETFMSLTAHFRTLILNMVQDDPRKRWCAAELLNELSS